MGWSVVEVVKNDDTIKTYPEALLPNTIGGRNVKRYYEDGYMRHVRFDFVRGRSIASGNDKQVSEWCDTSDNLWDWSSENTKKFTCRSNNNGKIAEYVIDN